jgi:PAS domain S-box-containing protein
MPENRNNFSSSHANDLLGERELLDAALKLARVGLWEFDIARKNLRWSDEVYHIHEVEVGTPVTVEEAINFYKAEHRVKIENAVNVAMADGKPWDLECILVTSTGRETWVRAIGEVVFENDTPIKIRGLFQDIDERKRQQLALAEQEFRFRSMLDHTFNFVGLLEPDGTILEVNKSALNFGGITIEQARDENFADAPWWSTSEEINQQVRDSIKKARSGQFIRYDVEVTGAAETMHIDFSISPVLDQRGEVKFLVPDARDITDRLETERRLTDSLNQYRRFVSYAPAAVAMFDNDMKYIAASSKWIEDYSLSGIDLIGKSHYEIFPEILEMPEWLDDHRRVLAGEEYQSEKDQFVRQDGSVQWLKYTLLPWYEKPGVIGGLTMYTADITNEVEYQEKLSAWNETLEKQVVIRTEELMRLNKEMEQFVYIASHDLQEPLRAISNYAGLIEPDELSDRGKHAVNRIKRSSQRMSDLVRGLLDYSLAGKSPKRKHVDLNEIVDEIKEDFHQIILETHGTIESDHLPHCWAARADMRQLLENLIANGLKYQDENSKPRIRISCQKQPDGWSFAVSDNGIGIKEEYHDKVFKIFSRLHTQDEYPGTGIGLSMCKKIIDSYDGKIWLESDTKPGTTFHFNLPNSSDEARIETSQNPADR